MSHRRLSRRPGGEDCDFPASDVRLQGSDFALPILMYHNVSDYPEPRMAAYYKVNTSPSVFRQQMQFLSERGYHTMTLDELAAWLSAPQRTALDPRRAVCITFDDGFRSVYTDAVPVLQNYGFTATVFLPTAFIGDTRRVFRAATYNSQSSADQECLTWPEVRELRRAGILFGSHTVTHPRLVEIPWDNVEGELRDSRAAIERQLGEPVNTFSFPFGFPETHTDFVTRFRNTLSSAGYGCCVTTRVGRVRRGADMFNLRRLPMNSLDDSALFRAKLEGGYDWLGGVQTLIKGLKLGRSAQKTLEERGSERGPNGVEPGRVS
jgi:peptidoglycan/xylan/chitin deacetylase (PgdA/CDA1 family)